MSKEYTSIGMRPFGEIKSKATRAYAQKWSISYHCEGFVIPNMV